MKQEVFIEKAKAASKTFADKKNTPTTPAVQFVKGALWAWEFLTEGLTVAQYEETLKRDIISRLETVEPWQESLITDTAKLMARRDRLEATIAEKGDLLEKFDKTEHPYYESNPLHVHLKELDRSIGLQREHLGLSYKVNPQRMKESPKRGVDNEDPVNAMLASVKAELDSVE